MRTTSKIERPSDIELTISVTATVREWERLAATLTINVSEQKQLRDQIGAAVRSVTKPGEPAGLVIGEIRSAVAE